MASKLSVYPSIGITTGWQRLTTTSQTTSGQTTVVNVSAAVYMNSAASATGQTYLAGGNVYEFPGVDPSTLYFSQVSAGAVVGGYNIVD